MKVLVTGGAGFIGSNLVERILYTKPDWEVAILDALTYAGRWENILPFMDSVYFFKGDITNDQLVDYYFDRFRPDLVLHLAAESHVDRSVTNPAIFEHTNVRGTQVLLEAARRHVVKKFHYVSTDEVYGELGYSDPAWTEESPLQPRSPYAASKAAAEHWVRSYGITFGLPITVSNCTNNIGPRCFPEKLVPRAIINILQGKPAELYGRGQEIREWIHASDHADAIILVADQGLPGETYLVSSNYREVNNCQVLELVCQIMGVDKEKFIKFIPNPRPGHDLRYALNSTKIRQQLGFLPRYETLEQAFRATISWYLDNQDWWLPLLKSGSNFQQFEKSFYREVSKT